MVDESMIRPCRGLREERIKMTDILHYVQARAHKQESLFEEIDDGGFAPLLRV